MKRILRLCGALALVLTSACGGASFTGRTEVQVELRNRSTVTMRDARVVFGDSVCAWGNVGPTFTKSYLGFSRPLTPEARLEWKETGGQRSERLDLRPFYRPGQWGRLIFTVLDGRISVEFEPRPPR